MYVIWFVLNINCLIVLSKLLELHNRACRTAQIQECSELGDRCSSDQKTCVQFAAKSEKAHSITCMLYPRPEGFLIIRMLLNILLHLWICISLHNRWAPRFPHGGHRASICLRPGQKSIIALDGSLKHTHTHTQLFCKVSWGSWKKTAGWLNVIMILCVKFWSQKSNKIFIIMFISMIWLPENNNLYGFVALEWAFIRTLWDMLHGVCHIEPTCYYSSLEGTNKTHRF